MSRLHQERRRRAARFLVALALFVAGPARGRAQPESPHAQVAAGERPTAPADDPEFTREFSRGLRAEDARDFERAQLHYARALARAEMLPAPSPRLRSLLALGWVHFNLRDYVRSVEYLKRAVADPALPAARAREAQALIDEASKLLGRLKIDVRPPAGEFAPVTVQVDGRTVPDPRDVAVAPGAYDVRASAPGFRTFAQRIEVAAGQTRTLASILEREDNASATRQAAWIAGGVAAASLAVGLGAGAYSWAKHGESDCRSGVDCSPADVADREAAIVAGDVSTAAFVVGGAAVAVSAFLFWHSSARDVPEPTATRVSLGLTSVQLTKPW